MKKSIFKFKNQNQICLITYFLNYRIDKDINKDFEFYSYYLNNLPDLVLKYYKNINWLHLGVNQSSIKKFNKIKKPYLIHNNSTCYHSLIDNNLSFTILFKSIFIFFKIFLKSLFMTNINILFYLRDSNINFYPFLKKDWITSTRGSQLINSIITIMIFDKLFSLLPTQKLGFYLYENQSWERALIGSWKKFKHGKLIGIDHTTGYMRFWDLRYFKSFKFYNSYKNNQFINDFQSVNSPVSKNFLISSGYPKSRIIETEAIRFNYLEKYISNTNTIKSSKNKLLIIADINFESSIKFLTDFKNILPHISNEVIITFRTHPGDPKINKTIKYVKNLNLFLSSNKLFYDLSNNDKIIIIGSSSVSLEAYLLKKDLIIYLNPYELNLSPINFLKGVDFVSNSKDLLNSINSEVKKDFEKQDLFWLDNSLSKWNSFLSKLST